jgi:glutathione synthase/RimK-type ligase-like ATP-grasp enzyme
VVIKPNRSSCGKGVRVFRRQGDMLIDGEGRSWTPEALLESVSAHSKRAHIIQERVFNHEDLAVLSGAAGLQTVRVVTILDRVGDPRILGAFFRAIVGNNWVDNIDMGRTGNLWVLLDAATGTMTEATMVGNGHTQVTHHPDTGREFAGQVIPMWAGVLDLARRAARAVWPVRTVGWDIAVTPSGPVLLEGNVWYAPPNIGQPMRDVFEAMHSTLPTNGIE